MIYCKHCDHHSHLHCPNCGLKVQETDIPNEPNSILYKLVMHDFTNNALQILAIHPNQTHLQKIADNINHITSFDRNTLYKTKVYSLNDTVPTT